MLVLTSSRLNFIDRGADQKKGKKQMPAFRKDYGNLATLRSLCKAGKAFSNLENHHYVHFIVCKKWRM